VSDSDPGGTDSGGLYLCFACIQTHIQHDPGPSRPELVVRSGSPPVRRRQKTNHPHRAVCLCGASSLLSAASGCARGSVVSPFWAPNARTCAARGSISTGGWDGPASAVPSGNNAGAVAFWELFIPGLGWHRLQNTKAQPPRGSWLPRKGRPLWGGVWVVCAAWNNGPQTGSVSQLGNFPRYRSCLVEQAGQPDPLDSTDQPSMNCHCRQLDAWLHRRAFPGRRWQRRGNRWPPPISSRGGVLALPNLRQGRSADSLRGVPRGFTHIEACCDRRAPFDGFLGRYSVSAFDAPTSRFGSPDEFRAFVNRCHAVGLWPVAHWRVPGHFPRTAMAWPSSMACHLYFEHADPRIGEPRMGT